MIRRLYVYLAAAASLALLVTGLAGAGAALLELLVRGGGSESTYRQTIATSGAEIMVALPLWLMHWSLAQRMVRRDRAERGATLRRLYLYGVIGGLLIALGTLAYSAVNSALAIALSAGPGRGDATAAGAVRSSWELAVVVAFWAYTLRVATADRVTVGESGGSATLRRWYAYGAQFGALLVALIGAASLLDSILLGLVSRAVATGAGAVVAGAVAKTLAGLGIWLFHRHWTATSAISEDDRRSTLRAVYGFAIVAIAVAATLTGIGQIAYWTLARLLGVARPSGLSGDALTALRGPFAMLVVFGVAWALIRRDLALDAAGAEARRQSGVRRLYVHLVAIVALGALASGAAELLWGLVDQLAAPDAAITATDFRDRISLSVTLVLLGTVVWILHWRPAPAIEERLSLSRRIYLFAVLLASVLLGVGSAIWLGSQLLRLLLAVGSSHPDLEMGHAFALLFVSVAIAAYHVRVLWVDTSIRAPSGGPARQAIPQEQTRESVPASIVVEISGATEEEVGQALAALPEGSRYHYQNR